MRSVTRIALAAGALPLLAGCGGSSATKTTIPATAATTSVSSTSAPPTPAPTTTAHASPASRTTTPPTGGAGLAAGPAGAARAGGGARGRSGASGGGAINARVPARFQLGPGGRLGPSTVSAPAFLAVAVTVTSSDGSAHTVTIGTPSPRTLAIPPHGSGTTLVPGLRAGTYPIIVDGTKRAALLIGGEPGP